MELRIAQKRIKQYTDCTYISLRIVKILDQSSPTFPRFLARFKPQNWTEWRQDIISSSVSFQPGIMKFGHSCTLTTGSNQKMILIFECLSKVSISSNPFGASAVTLNPSIFPFFGLNLVSISPPLGAKSSNQIFCFGMNQ